ncbi:MAG: protein-disulfide reductase DsbD [Pseudomonadota bacterium]
MLKRTLIYIGVLATTTAFAIDDPLRVEDAFRYAVNADDQTITVAWDIEDGHYLYRPRMGFRSTTAGVALGEPVYPKGKIKNDEFFGKTEIYRGQQTVTIPYTNQAGASQLLLDIRSQGCSDEGLCYPPQTWNAPVALPVAATTASNDTLLSALGSAGIITNEGETLAPEVAFPFFADMVDDYTIRVRFNIADEHYLYKHKFEFTAASDAAQLGRPRLPTGKAKYDEFFGDTEVYYGQNDILIPISRATPDAGEIELTAAFQGCSEDGICYPPMERTTLIALSQAGNAPPPTLSADASGGSGAGPVSEQDGLAELIRTGSLPIVLLTFFALGVGLAFTPCVLPMVPILSSMIMGQGENVTARRGFVMSLAYVLPMALTYTVAGVAVALAGKNIQAIFQNPYILVTFAVVFVALALAMFDVYQFQMPTGLQNRLNRISSQQSGGSLVGVGVMGVLSALIVGPCVAAPLVGVLIFIGQSGDAVRGGLTLFALSLGMGAPLLLFGASAGKLAVSAGAWMNTVKGIFGILLLGVAVWLLARVLPPRITMVLWAALAVGLGVVLGVFKKGDGMGPGPLSRFAGVAATVYGLALGVSAALGGFDPVSPLRGTPFHAEQHLEFERIKTLDDLDLAVARASAEGRPVMLDFYADWCVSCKEMEKYVFTRPEVHSALGDALLLQADVTANDAEDQALLKRFNIFGPPTIAFFDPQGQEIESARVVGYMKAEPFTEHVSSTLSERTVAELVR